MSKSKYVSHSFITSNFIQLSKVLRLGCDRYRNIFVEMCFLEINEMKYKLI